MKRAIATWLTHRTGWKPVVKEELPPKYVLIAAPHTSNWDAFHLITLAISINVDINWVTKDTLFRPPLGWLIRSLGAIPVNRRERTNMVDQMVQLFAENPHLILVVPAEGTRGRAEYWKSGFYHIAQKANVPIVLGFLDYGEKRGGFGPVIPAGTSLEDTMATIRDFYKDIEGKFPEAFGPVRLKAEEGETQQEPDGEPTKKGEA
jgi:1-acyl-sn-glycerol-3-phosphate acyltransferase